MSPISDLRTDRRIRHQAEIQFENFLSDTHHRARMFNYSPGGMYFEADYAPLPGTEIFIGIRNSPYDAGADLYRAQIRWRRQLSDGASPFYYGVGVQYCSSDGK